MAENEKTVVVEQESTTAASKKEQRINRWLNIIEILKEILTCLKP